MFAFNDDWQDTQATELRDSGLQPSDDREAAIIGTLPPGSYTAIVRSITPSVTGVGLIEIYRR